MSQITISNPALRRKWGWAYSTRPSGDGAFSIDPPTAPQFVGTLKQISTRISEDQVYRSLSCYSTSLLFFDGRPISSVEKLDFLDDNNELDLEDREFGLCWHEASLSTILSAIAEATENGSNSIKIKFHDEEA